MAARRGRTRGVLAAAIALLLYVGSARAGEPVLVEPLNAEWQKAVPNGASVFAAYRAEAARVREQK